MDDVRAALSHRDFRLLWLGQAASTLGDALVFVAIGLFVVDLTGSATDTGLILACYSAPLVVFLLIGGVIADRLPRRAVMITTDLVRAGLHATLAVLILTDAVEVWHMALIGIGFGTAEAFFRPAYTGLLPQTVDEDRIQEANAMTGATRELTMFIGPAIATVLVVSGGAGFAFALDALTFLVSAFFLAGVRPRRRGAEADADDVEAAGPPSVLREMREGWSAVRERAWVWATILAFSFTLLVALAPFFTLGPTVAIDVYDDKSVYGISNVMWGVGAFCGALIGIRWKPRFPMRMAMLVALPWTLSFTIYALGAPLPLVWTVIFLSGTGLGVFSVWWETALAERIPPHMLSRVSAYDWMGSLALLPLGYVLAGPIGAAVGEATALAVGGVLGFVAMALGCLPKSTWLLERLAPAPLAQGAAIGGTSPVS